MKSITTHVLDVTLGRPAFDVAVQLYVRVHDEFREIAHGRTNHDGRIVEWLDCDKFTIGIYQIRFDTAGYFASTACTDYFFPEVKICFEIKDTQRHYHVPLLLSPFGYSTYRGS
jgi:5-hydroxyisourate hydrolase